MEVNDIQRLGLIIVIFFLKPPLISIAKRNAAKRPVRIKGSDVPVIKAKKSATVDSK